jgi:hypothetical protein
MQAVGNPGLPDVTVYRMVLRDIVEWKNAAATRGVFCRFLLRHAPDAWDVYNAAGKLEHLCSDVVGRRMPDQQTGALADTALLKSEAAIAVGGGATCVAQAEAHACASVADHSNYGHVLRSMIRDASEEDLPHMYVVESKSCQHRVSGVYADVAKLSRRAQDQFLDSYQSLRAREPIDTEDYARLFVGRTAALRVDYLSDICADAGKIGGLDEEEILSIRLSVGCRGVEFRRDLLDKLLHLTGGRTTVSVDGAVEKLDEDALRRVSANVVIAMLSTPQTTAQC